MTTTSLTNKEILTRLYKIIYPYRVKMLIATFSMIMVAAFSGVQTWLIKDILDKIFINKNILFLNMLPVIVILVFFFKGLFYYLYQYLLEKVGQEIIKTLRIRIFNHIHSQSLTFFHNIPTGELISRVISDVNLMQGAVSNALVGILRDFFQVIILLGIIFYMNWRLALLSFIIMPAAVIPIVKFGRYFRKLSTKTQEETARISNILHETIGGNHIVKAFNMEKYEGKRFKGQVNSLFAILMQDARYRCFQHPLMELIGGIGIALIIWFGGNEVIRETMTPGEFFSFLVALIMVYDPIKGVSKVNSTIQQGLAAATRVFTLLDIKPDIKDKPDAQDLPPFSRLIEFNNISFTYNNERTSVLENINLQVPVGEALAIVGPSGGGKTTLTNLVPRFYDVASGSLKIDGLDVRDATLSSLRRQIAIVTQQTILFNDTVAKNIAYGKPDISMQKIEKAAEAAHALEFIKALPEGFETIIGESGTKLSGGERQRISIARAILKDAPILILDEATSALDTESEREVQKALENLMKDRTTFVIAHRLSTIKNVDRIIVIKAGKIVEEGTHESLLASQGEYELLHNLQYD